MAGSIVYKVGFRLDGKDLSAQIKAPLQQVHAEIQDISKKSKHGMSAAFAEGIRQASTLESVLKRATTNKGTSFIAMNKALRQAGSSVDQMISGLSGAGMQKSLNVFLQTFSQADRKVIALNKNIAEMGRILAQSVRYSIAQDIQRFVIGQVQQAVGWVQKLNSEIIKIGNFAEMSGSQMEAVFQRSIEKARQLHVTALDYAQASFIFYQQGLPEGEIDRRAQTVIKAARASLQDITETGKQMTAIWNTYRMSGDEIERAASVAAALSSTTAAQFADIATGMQIAASGASMLGVAYDSLAAIMATVVSVTQQSASVVGNAYKTIFARFANLRTTGMDDEGVELGRITQQLGELGINVLDATGQLRDLDDVIMEIGLSWDTYSQKQQIAIAQVAGGIRQYQHFLALMQNFDMYLDNLATANNEVYNDALVRQYLISLQSVDHAKRMKTEAWQQAFGQLFRADDQLTFFRTLESIGHVMGDIIEKMGSLRGIAVAVTAIMAGKLLPKILDTGATIGNLFANATVEQQIEKIGKTMNSQIKERAEALAKIEKDGTGGTAEEHNLKMEKQKLEITKEIATQNALLRDKMQGANDAEKLRLENQIKINSETEAEAHNLLDSLSVRKEILDKQKKTVAQAQKQIEADEGITGVKEAQKEQIEAAEIARAEALSREAEIKKEIKEQEEIIARSTEKEQERLDLETERLIKQEKITGEAREQYDAAKKKFDGAKKEHGIAEAEFEAARMAEREHASAIHQKRLDMAGLEGEALQKAQEQLDMYKNQSSELKKIVKQKKSAKEAALAEMQAAQSKLQKEQNRLTIQAGITKSAQRRLTTAQNEQTAAQAKLTSLRTELTTQENIRDQANKTLRAMEGMGKEAKAPHAALTQSKNLLDAMSTIAEGALDGMTDEEVMENVKGQFSDMAAELRMVAETLDGELKTNFISAAEVIEGTVDSNKDLKEALNDILPTMHELNEISGVKKETAAGLNSQLTQQAAALTALAEANSNVAANKKALEAEQKKQAASMQAVAKGIGQIVGAGALMYKTMNNLVEAAKNGDVSLGLLLSTLMKMGPAIVLVTKTLGGLKAAKHADNIASKYGIALNIKLAAAIKTKGIAAKFAAIGVWLLMLPLKLLVAIVLAAMAAIIALTMAIMHFINRNNQAREAQRELAQQMQQSAQRARELAGELDDLADTVENLNAELDAGNITFAEFNEGMSAAIERAKELNRLDPSLNLMFTGDHQAFADSIREAEDRLNEFADQQTQAAMRTMQQGMQGGRGSRGSDNQYLTLNRGFNRGETQDLVRILGDLGAEVSDNNRIQWDEMARYFNDTVIQLQREGNYALAQKFMAEMDRREDWDVFVDMVAAYDAIADAQARALQVSEFQKQSDEDRQRILIEGRDLQREYQAAVQELHAAQARRNAAEEAGNVAQVAYLDTIIAHYNQLINTEDDYGKSLRQRAQDFAELSQGIIQDGGEDAMLQRVMDILNSNFDRNMFDDAGWQDLIDNGLARAKEGYWGLITVTNDYQFAVIQTRGALEGLTEALSEFNREGSAGEQREQINAIEDRIKALKELDIIIEGLPENFMALTEAEQQFHLARIETAEATARSAQYEADHQAALYETELAYERLNRAKEAAAANDVSTQLAAQQARVAASTDAMAAAQAEYQRTAQAAAEATWHITGKNRRNANAAHAESVARMAEIAAYHAQQELELARLQAAQSGFEQSVRDAQAAYEEAQRRAAELAQIAADEQNRLLGIRREAYKELLEMMHNLSADTFSGSAAQQMQDFLELQKEIAKANQYLLEVYGDQAVLIASLPEYFLALTDSQQNAYIAAANLRSAWRDFHQETTLAEEALSRYGATSEELRMAQIRLEIATTQLGRALAENANLDFDQMDRYARHLQRVAANSDHLSSSLADNRRASLEVAAAIMQMNRGIETIDGNIESWKDTLNNAARESEEFASALWEIEGAMADLLNVAEHEISDTFMDRFLGTPEQINYMLGLLDDVRMGVEGALETLQNYAAQDFINDIFGDEAREPLRIFDQELGEFTDNFFGRMEELRDINGDIIEDMGKHWVYLGEQLREAMEIGDVVDYFEGDVEAIKQQMLQMVAAAGMSVAEANAAFAKLGFNVQLETAMVKKPQSFPTTYTVTEAGDPREMYMGTDEYGNRLTRTVVPTRTFSFPGEPQEMMAYQEVLAMSAQTPTGDGGTPKIDVNSSVISSTRRGGGRSAAAIANRAPSQRGGGGGGGGGGGSAPNARDHQEGTEFERRFGNITVEMRRLNRELSRLNAALSLAFGANKIRLLQRQQAIYAQLGRQYQQMYRYARAYAEIDRQYMEALVGEGFLQFNEHGHITNINEFMDVLTNLSAAAASAANESIDYFNNLIDGWEFMSEYAQEAAKAIIEAAMEYEGAAQDFINRVYRRLDRHVEMVETALNSFDAAIDQARNSLRNELQQLQVYMDLNLRIDQRFWRMMEMRLSRLGQQAGAAITEELNAGIEVGIAQMQRYYDVMNNLYDFRTRLATDASVQAKFIEEFGQAAFDHFEKYGEWTSAVEQVMNDMADAALDSIEAVQDMIDRLIFTYHEAVASFIQEFDRLISRFDTSMRLLNAWTRIWQLSGQAYSNPRFILELMDAQVDTLETRITSMQHQLEIQELAAEHAYEQYRMLVEAGADPFMIDEARRFKQEMENEARSLAASIKEIAVQALEIIQQRGIEAARIIGEEFMRKLGPMFSDWGETGSLINVMDRIRDFYEKQWNTDLVFRNLLRDGDRLLHMYEKRAEWERRILGYKEEGKKMTADELAVLQAWFELDVLKAELEAARNEEQEAAAKSTMRLARDASGNWSYVFSHDQELEDNAAKIADLERRIDELYVNIIDMQYRITRRAEDAIWGIIQEIHEAELAYAEAMLRGDYVTAEAIRNRINFLEELLDMYSAMGDRAFDGLDYAMMRHVEFARDNFRHLGDIIRQHVDESSRHFDILGTAIEHTRKRFDTSTMGMITGLNNFRAVHDHTLTTMMAMNDRLRENYDDNRRRINAILTQIGVDHTDLENHIRGELGKIRDENRRTAESTEQLRDRARIALQGMHQKIMQVVPQWIREFNRLRDAIKAAIRAFDDLQRRQLGDARPALAGGEGRPAAPRVEPPTGGGDGGNQGGGSTDGDTGGQQPPPQQPSQPVADGRFSGGALRNSGSGHINMRRYIEDSFRAEGLTPPSTEDQWKRVLRGTWGNMHIKESQPRDGNFGIRGINAIDNWNQVWEAFNRGHLWTIWNNLDTPGYSFPRYQFRTGGLADFTGPAWLDGTSRRPELVLNPQDTQNMLSAVQIMRDSINRHLNGLGSSQASLLRRGDNERNDLNQQVHIQADFPNVTSSGEIEAAFNNLINEAAQYTIQPRV